MMGSTSSMNLMDPQRLEKPNRTPSNIKPVKRHHQRQSGVLCSENQTFWRNLDSLADLAQSNEERLGQQSLIGERSVSLPHLGVRSSAHWNYRCLIWVNLNRVY